MRVRSTFLPGSRIGRTGAILLEVLVSGVVLGTLLAAIIPTLRLVRIQLRHADRQALAMSEVSNIVETLYALEQTQFDRLDPATIEVSEFTASQLPDAELQVSITDTDEDAAGDRITVQLSFVDDWGNRLDAARLVAFRFEKEKTP